MCAYLHTQADGVKHDEQEHEVLEVAGRHHIPHPVLVRVLRDVAPQGPCFEGVLHTLALGSKVKQREGSLLGEGH